MKDDPAAIAAKLTEAQRMALTLFTDQWCLETYADGRTLRALDRKGLTDRYVSTRDFREVRVTVTPLGQSVRAHLKDQS